MAPRRRCPVCGSKQWRKEPSSGLITCDEGHVLQNYRNETTVVDELGPHTVRKRALKSNRKKKEWQSKADPKLYHGERGKFHYYQCLQLLLRMQISALIDAWHLPPEFEVVCRDIWALHLSLLPRPPVAEPYLFAQGHSTEQDASAPDEAKDAQHEDASDKEGSDSVGSSDTESSSSEDEEDYEMDQLLRENSIAPSSSSESDEETPNRGERFNVKSRKRGVIGLPFESPAANISVLMLACWTLRLPVMYMDFTRLIETYDLPYLDPMRLLPQSLTRHLTKQTIQALSPHFAPTSLQVHSLTSRLAKLMYKTYGIMTPECNAAPLLWRATRALEGTPTLYMLSKTVARTCSLTLTLHYTLSPALKQVKSRDPDHHKYDNAPPEVALVCIVIVVLKLAYGFDGKNRTPQETEDPACALPSFTEYLAALQCAQTREEAAKKSLLMSSLDPSTSMLDFDEGDFDKYMDFCEKALLPRESQVKPNAVLDEFFPLSPHNAASTINDIPTTAVTPDPLQAARVRENSSNPRPGQLYRIYNTRDVLGSLPEDYEKLLHHAAGWAGVDEDYLQGVVERFEHRICRWWETIRKAEAKIDDEAVRSDRHTKSGATNAV